MRQRDDVDGGCPAEHRAAATTILNWIIHGLEQLDDLLPTADDVDALHQVIDELRAIDFALAGPNTSEGLQVASGLLHRAIQFDDAGYSAETVDHVLRLLIDVAAVLAHDYAIEAGKIAPGNDPAAGAELIAHWRARYRQTVQVFNRDRRRRYADRVRVHQRVGHERRPRQRVGARRAAGIRSGEDPGGDDGEWSSPAPAVAGRRR